VKWDPDKALAALEPSSCPGTGFTRLHLPVSFMTTVGLKPTAAEVERGGTNAWCLSIGYAYAPKAFFYGRTMRDTFLKARRAVKGKALRTFTPWGNQPFEPTLKKKKAPDLRKRRARAE
jgi:Asp-tRNA(Asn)/Glu-tRNA(Gln) amidotransferase A subunit family amidase